MIELMQRLILQHRNKRWVMARWELALYLLQRHDYEERMNAQAMEDARLRAERSALIDDVIARLRIELDASDGDLRSAVIRQMAEGRPGAMP